MPSLLTGLADGAIDQVSDYPQLIKLGYDVATKPEVQTLLWEGVKNITPGAVKDMAVGAIKEKWDRYANASPQVTTHEAGFDAVGVASALVGGKLLETIAETGEKFKKGVQGAGNFLDDIYNAQKSIINQWKNNISTATNIRKGNFGEMASDAFLTEKNFQPLHTRLQSIDAATRQGIDGVFKKGNEYFIVEAKYNGTARLGKLTDGTKQMSESWISQNNFQRLRNAVGNNVADDIITVGYKRVLADVSPNGSIIYKQLDENANVITVLDF